MSIEPINLEIVLKPIESYEHTNTTPQHQIGYQRLLVKKKTIINASSLEFLQWMVNAVLVYFVFRLWMEASIIQMLSQFKIKEPPC